MVFLHPWQDRPNQEPDCHFFQCSELECGYSLATTHGLRDAHQRQERKGKLPYHGKLRTVLTWLLHTLTLSPTMHFGYIIGHQVYNAAPREDLSEKQSLDVISVS